MEMKARWLKPDSMRLLSLHIELFKALCRGSISLSWSQRLGTAASNAVDEALRSSPGLPLPRQIHIHR